ncbi:Gfo/Idh/MocA family protein [Rhodococcus koreensis]
MTVPRIAVVGAGLIGRRHIEEIVASPSAALASIVDPMPAGEQFAAEHGVAAYSSLRELFETDRPDGVILATPNLMHVQGGLDCVEAGVPVIVEKPIGATVADALRLVDAAEKSGVPVLTGHHRQHSSIMTAAREVVGSGRLGEIVAVTGTCLFYKPDGYHDENCGWRRRPGGGPILLNLIHDVNNLQSLVGDVVKVQATTSNARRGFPVEDTAAVLITFAGGALGTFLLSDVAASGRSWEQTSQENLRYPTYPDENCYHLVGTTGELAVPTMRIRNFGGERSWWNTFEETTERPARIDPLAAQIEHFAAVIRGDAKPIVTARDGLKSLQVVEAVAESARTGEAVTIG